MGRSHARHRLPALAPPRPAPSRAGHLLTGVRVPFPIAEEAVVELPFSAAGDDIKLERQYRLLQRPGSFADELYFVSEHGSAMPAAALVARGSCVHPSCDDYAVALTLAGHSPRLTMEPTQVSIAGVPGAYLRTDLSPSASADQFHRAKTVVVVSSEGHARIVTVIGPWTSSTTIAGEACPLCSVRRADGLSCLHLDLTREHAGGQPPFMRTLLDEVQRERARVQRIGPAGLRASMPGLDVWAEMRAGPPGANDDDHASARLAVTWAGHRDLEVHSIMHRGPGRVLAPGGKDCTVHGSRCVASELAAAMVEARTDQL